jgi:hypothetical protein
MPQQSGHDTGFGDESPTYDYSEMAKSKEGDDGRDRMDNPMLEESDSDGGTKNG